MGSNAVGLIHRFGEEGIDPGDKQVAASRGNRDSAFDRTWFTAAFAGRVATSGLNQYYGPGGRH